MKGWTENFFENGVGKKKAGRRRQGEIGGKGVKGLTGERGEMAKKTVGVDGMKFGEMK